MDWSETPPQRPERARTGSDGAARHFHVGTFHPLAGTGERIGITRCSCGWESTVELRWHGFGRWRGHTQERPDQ
ncbi:MAG: hypothetical protein M3P11_13285 [Actinomycetota bacterium]|nr:hypothetical protein [Actinomycetota bacterium]